MSIGFVLDNTGVLVKQSGTVALKVSATFFCIKENGGTFSS